MPFEKILDEVSKLEGVSTRLEALADHPSGCGAARKRRRKRSQQRCFVGSVSRDQTH